MFNPTMEGFPGTISVKFSVDVNGWPRYQWHTNIAENFNRLSRAHERYRQTTDGRATGQHSERKNIARNKSLTHGVRDYRLVLLDCN